MNVKLWFEVIGDLFLNLSASWFAAVLILPNFISFQVAMANLITSIANGTILLLIVYKIKDYHGTTSQ